MRIKSTATEKSGNRFVGSCHSLRKRDLNTGLVETERQKGSYPKSLKNLAKESPRKN